MCILFTFHMPMAPWCSDFIPFNIHYFFLTTVQWEQRSSSWYIKLLHQVCIKTRLPYHRDVLWYITCIEMSHKSLQTLEWFCRHLWNTCMWRCMYKYIINITVRWHNSRAKCSIPTMIDRYNDWAITINDVRGKELNYDRWKGFLFAQHQEFVTLQSFPDSDVNSSWPYWQLLPSSCDHSSFLSHHAQVAFMVYL